VIAAQAEVQASKLMREAADILNHPAAMQIRYLETLQTMSNHPNTKVIFMPMSDGGIDIKKAAIYENMANQG
jgi:regulator of protease activity HflC (stomatin/prohibitin superfamily)